MSRLINRLVSEATAPIGAMSTRLFKKAVLIFVAVSCLFGGVVFLTIALFVFVQPLVGTVISALGIGGLFLSLAIICIIVASRGSSRHSAPVALASGPLPVTDGTPTSQKRAFASNIDEAVAPIVDVLRDSGLDRERRALEAGAEIAKQLHPFSLAAVAIAGGFIFGRNLKQRNMTPG